MRKLLDFTRPILAFLTVCVLFMAAMMAVIFSVIIGFQPQHHLQGVGLALGFIGCMALMITMLLRGTLDPPAPRQKRRHLFLVP